ncbi:DUF1648 domain-containing protein [Paenibacillus sp. S150]|uniref:DUF1648 domain-containing protein n=1 Tax=Paenibacillus sp. S150 TaxID=2749826 RepID=UPI001C56BBFA|nr:DUF1648 domain-containing protein [Paenibacillus sp. S150]MBW4082376.1 DUF1648 domain-containing protein [Paenibacillus sp. S150]
MMFKSRLTMTLSSAAALVPIILYFYLYPRLPVFVPIHYDGATADRFVNKWSVDVALLCMLGWFGFGFMRLLQFLLRKIFLSSYIHNIAIIHQIWNAATLLVTAGFAAISVCALLAMV